MHSTDTGAGPSPDRRRELDPGQQAELAEILRVYQKRWVIVGPCLDGGWYATPRHDQTRQRVRAATLAELSIRLKDRENGD